MLKNKRGISPVITTVLLVFVALVIAAIIITFFMGFFKEKIMKFDERIELACEEVKLQVSVDNGKLYVNNIGSVAVYQLRARLSGSGESRIVEFSEKNFLPGSSKVLEPLSFSLTGTIEIIPVLLGQTEKNGEIQSFQCPEETWQTAS